jgi:tetratricopeptide (TPR) repeat protein
VRRVVAAACILLLAPACAGGPLVERAYDGHVVQGRSIEPEAYAAFLTGAIAEASADGQGALRAYTRAAHLDPRAPEAWTRIGAVRCTLNPADGHADDAFARALSIDDRYAGAWAAKAKCSLGRHDEAAALEAARRAAQLDPAADGAHAIIARAGRVDAEASRSKDAEASRSKDAEASRSKDAEASRSKDAEASRSTRDALVALTETARDHVAAWDALASWAESRGDVALWTRALGVLAKAAPARRDAVARAAEELAGDGEIGAARSVAAAAVDTGDEPFAEDRRPLAARLAIDEAIARGDVPAVRLRATRARISLEEAGARAFLAGRHDVASAIEAAVVLADPDATGAKLVLAASDGRDVLGASWELGRRSARASGASFVAFGVAVVRVLPPAQARASLASIAHAPVVSGDDLVVRPAVELASRGVVDAAALPPDGVVELSVLRGEASVEGPSAPDRRLLDARHEYLAMALADPQSARTGALAERLAGVLASDPVVAAASALVQIGVGARIDAGAPGALLGRDPGDALLAATALRLANKIGDAEAATRARAALTALGRDVRGAGDDKKHGAAF